MNVAFPSLITTLVAMGTAAAIGLIVLLAMRFLARSERSASRSRLELQRNAETLQEYSQRLDRTTRENELLIMNTIDVICSIDRDGRFVRVSPASLAFWGYEPHELEGRPFLEFVHPDDREKSMSEAALTMNGRPAIHIQNRYVCKNGEIKVVSWSGLWSSDDELMFCVGRDSTEPERLRERLQEAHDELQQLNVDLEAFCYSVSHDLRAPLRAVAGYARMLGDELGPDVSAEGSRFLDVIQGEARRMGQLIDDLLSFSRTGRSRLTPAPLRMGALFHEVYQEVAAVNQSRRIDFEVQEPMPLVLADRALVRQVAMNLISNAVKFTGSKSDARIRVVGEPAANGFAIFTVEDNGAGFDPSYADKLFGVFERCHSEAEFEGTGVGLAIAKKVVTRHGGEIWADSVPGDGATFRFSLPLAPVGARA